MNCPPDAYYSRRRRPDDPDQVSHLMAGLIPDARIRIYDDAAHAFLFQYPDRSWPKSTSSSTGSSRRRIRMSDTQMSSATAEALPRPSRCVSRSRRRGSDFDRAMALTQRLGGGSAHFPLDDHFRIITAGLPGFDPVRDGRDDGDARLGEGHVPGRRRPPGGARGADQPRRGRQRDLAGPGSQGDSPARDPGQQSHGSFASSATPDHRYMPQEITSGRPGGGVVDGCCCTVQLLHETSIHHGDFEAVAPPHDWWNWPAYMDARGRQHAGRRRSRPPSGTWPTSSTSSSRPAKRRESGRRAWRAGRTLTAPGSRSSHSRRVSAEAMTASGCCLPHLLAAPGRAPRLSGPAAVAGAVDAFGGPADRLPPRRTDARTTQALVTRSARAARRA